MPQSINLSARFLLLAWTVLVLCLGGCEMQPKPVAQVGEIAITAQDIAYRQAVMAVRSGQEVPAHLALFQLIEEDLMVEVGRAYGVVISPEMLAEEAVRVQTTSRDPDTLARIRAVFGDDDAAYHRLVLQPILVSQLLHARFDLGHDIQAEPLSRAKEILTAAIADPTALSELAQEFDGEYRQLEVVNGRFHYDNRPSEKKVPPELGQYGTRWPDYDKEFVEQVVVKLTVGELHAKVVEDRYSFMIVRLLNREGDDVQLEGVIIAKLAFDPWFQAQSQRVPLVIHDSTLKATLLAEVDVPYIIDRLVDD